MTGEHGPAIELLETLALASVVLVATLGPIVAAVILLRRRARSAQQRLDSWRTQLAADLGFSLEYNDAIVGTLDACFTRIVWSSRNAGGIRGGPRAVTYCERPFERRLGLHLALSTGWPWGGPKKVVAGIRRAISVRCDSADREGPLLASIAPIANSMPDDLTLEIDDATVRVFGWGHVTDVEDLRERLRYAIRLGQAVSQSGQGPSGAAAGQLTRHGVRDR
jgi:hypothetical protein